MAYDEELTRPYEKASWERRQKEPTEEGKPRGCGPGAEAVSSGPLHPDVCSLLSGEGITVLLAKPRWGHRHTGITMSSPLSCLVRSLESGKDRCPYAPCPLWFLTLPLWMSSTFTRYPRWEPPTHTHLFSSRSLWFMKLFSHACSLKMSGIVCGFFISLLSGFLLSSLKQRIAQSAGSGSPCFRVSPSIL